MHGYRAPSYSITRKSLWALDILVEEGFSYDSSIFPIVHDVYGIPGGRRFPHQIETATGKIKEFPISTFPMKIGKWSSQLPVSGGGYLRLLPAPLVELALRYINDHELQPAIVYFHPWEIDPDQPRIRAGMKSRFRHYLNLDRMELKMRYLLKRFRFSSARHILNAGTDNDDGLLRNDGLVVGLDAMDTLPKQEVQYGNSSRTYYGRKASCRNTAGKGSFPARPEKCVAIS